MWTSVAEERTKLWKARHDAYWASLTLRPGAQGLSTDVCVPISRLAECIAETEADIAELGLIAPIVGHVGDGNFHALVLIDTDDPEGDRSWRRNSSRGSTCGRSRMDGTCTGEHGIGQGKVGFMSTRSAAGRRRHARDQGGARSRQDPQSGQDMADGLRRPG